MLRRMTAVLAATLMVASCSDQPTPVEPSLAPTDASLARHGPTFSGCS